MSYLKKLGLGKSSYDKFPYIKVQGYEDQCWSGWESISGKLREVVERSSSDRLILAVECYPGVFDDEIFPALRDGLDPALCVEMKKEAFKSAAEIDTMMEPELCSQDPLFGKLTRLELTDFLDPAKTSAIRRRIKNVPTGLVLVYGPGAMLCCEADCLVFADMPRWETQKRQRAGRISNLGARNRGSKASLLYKRSFFIDWRVCDRLKRRSMGQWDFLLDTCIEGDPRMLAGDAFRAGLKEIVKRPFRVVPFFDPGVWGGQWMREVCDLQEGPPNYAWCFDCVPEENSLLLGFGDVRVEIPAINLVFHCPEELLGEPVYGRYGAEFPIRFDLLDTMQGQNLSFQVHPMIDYANEHFGIRYTQDESYYILDAEPEAHVYLGLADNVDADAMLEDLEVSSEDSSRMFEDSKYIARFPAKKHDHFLIPAGTCHCSGANSMVLEISHTPFIYTFKLWDWGRLDLNGEPRTLNLKRGAENIQWNRTKSWVEPRLVNAIEKITKGDGWREERTGLYRSQAFETRRHWFNKKVEHHTKGESVHVLNLVDGEEILVESPTSVFNPFLVHYAETFIIPAAVGAYTIKPVGRSDGMECATIKAYIRVNG